VSHVRRFDHVGLTVADLDVVTAFFVALGLEVEGRTFVEGEFLDTVCGIPDSRTEIVMLKPPDDGTRLELSSFVRPDSVPGSPAAMANELGLRNVAFEVNDLQAAVDWAATEGYGLVGGIGEYEGVWRMAYVRGPEGIIVSPSASAEPRNARICRDPHARRLRHSPATAASFPTLGPRHNREDRPHRLRTAGERP
jgi:catechol 2,3-dioxygenase-like lactoylglutathione lyase family enzyme